MTPSNLGSESCIRKVIFIQRAWIFFILPIYSSERCGRKWFCNQHPSSVNTEENPQTVPEKFSKIDTRVVFLVTKPSEELKSI